MDSNQNKHTCTPYSKFTFAQQNFRKKNIHVIKIEKTDLFSVEICWKITKCTPNATKMCKKNLLFTNDICIFYLKKLAEIFFYG